MKAEPFVRLPPALYKIHKNHDQVNINLKRRCYFIFT